MKKIVFATNNQNKLNEVKKLLSGKFDILSLADILCTEELPETRDTLEGNAVQKAQYVFEKYGHNCFADDTGLEITALDKRPGVYSARYAGEHKDANANMDKVLSELSGAADRNACFKTVIALIENGIETLFIGQIDGEILENKQGNQGFGYDPIFKPAGHTKSFAEMSVTEKNMISHRALAIEKLIRHLG